MTQEPTFEQWSASNMRGLLRTAWLLTGDVTRAEDLVQSTLLRCWTRWPRISRMDDIPAYVRRMLTRAYLASGRRKWHREMPTAHIPDRALDGPGPGADHRSALVEALRRLPPGQRAVLVLRFAEDLSEAQAAAQLGVSIGTIKSQASRGLRALRQDARLLQETDPS